MGFKEMSFSWELKLLTDVATGSETGSSFQIVGAAKEKGLIYKVRRYQGGFIECGYILTMDEVQASELGASKHFDYQGWKRERTPSEVSDKIKGRNI